MISFKNDEATLKDVKNDEYFNQFDPVINLMNEVDGNDFQNFMRAWKRVMVGVQKRYSTSELKNKERVEYISSLLGQEPIAHKRWTHLVPVWIMNINNRLYFISVSPTGFQVDVHKETSPAQATKDLNTLADYMQLEQYNGKI